MNTKERINKAVAFLKGNQIIKFQKDILKYMGADKNTVSQALLGNEKYLTENFIRRFADVFPCINAEWLLLGNGEMLKPDAESIPTQNSNIDTQQALSWLKDKDEVIKQKDEEIRDLRAQVDTYRSELERLRIAIANSDHDVLKKEIAV